MKYVFIGIILVVATFLIYCIASIFKKKGKKDKKAKKSKDSKPKDNGDAPALTKTPREPKINKKKLKEAAAKDAVIEPAFDKEQLEKEREEALKKELEKNKQNQMPKNQYMFPGMPSFPFPSTSSGMRTMPTSIAPKTTIMPTSSATSLKTTEPKTSSVPFSSIVASSKKSTPQVLKKEEAEFVDILKDMGAIKPEASFGESLMIKEAVDTPAAKKEMKRKREKWML